MINAAGLYSDRVARMAEAVVPEILPRKGEEYLLDKHAKRLTRRVIFPLPTKTTKGVLIIPTADGNTMVGPTAEEIHDRGDVSTSTIGKQAIIAAARQLIPVLALPLQVDNLNPAAPPLAESPLDQLFSLFLQKRPHAVADSEWVVAIDPGHGGQDPGALGKDGITEQSVNLGVALQLQKLLKMRRAAPVVMTRDGDYAVSAAQRLEALGRGKADVLLSLHTQTFATPAPQGLCLFVAPFRPDGSLGGFGSS